MTATLSFDGIVHRYAATGFELGPVDLAVAPGELVAVIGTSGCGKSTLLKIAAGFLKPDRGGFRIDGTDATATPPRQRDLGIVFQSYALFPHMNARDNVAYPLALRGMDKRRRRAEAEAMLGRVGLEGLGDRRSAQLSGGQQQRVALARALVFGPRALLLDEPLSALDATIRLAMRDEIRRLQRAQGIATLHVTHDQEEALSIADRIVVMRAGRIAQVGTPREIYEQPADRWVAGFVGHANLWEGRVAALDRIDTPIGPLHTTVTLPPAGTLVTVLVRPENVLPASPGDTLNRFAGALAADRFLGSLRRFDLAVNGVLLTGETRSAEPISAVHIPPDAVRVLPLDPALPKP